MKLFKFSEICAIHRLANDLSDKRHESIYRLNPLVYAAGALLAAGVDHACSVSTGMARTAAFPDCRINPGGCDQIYRGCPDVPVSCTGSEISSRYSECLVTSNVNVRNNI